MNVNLYYKGQVISIKTDRKYNLKRVLECSLPKFEQHFYQELLLFGPNLRLRSKRSNGLLNLNNIVGLTLQDDDTIIVEPKENMTNSSTNMHTPKRYDLSNIDNNYSPVTALEYFQMKSNNNSQMKNSTKQPFLTDSANPDNRNRYQKFNQFHVFGKTSQKCVNPFDRNDTRRSLGAVVARQYDEQDYSKKRMGDSNNFDSDSSISDFSNLAKPLTNKRPAELPDIQTKSAEFENQRSLSKSAPASPMKPMIPPRSPHTHVSLLNAHNVRTIGNKIHMSIVKKPNVGLGFTVVARDNQVLYGSTADIANSVVILVNKILPNGGAAEDNRLRPGDRLLEVDGKAVTGLKEATEKLRAISENMVVNLLISRVDRYEMQSIEQTLSRPIPQLSRKLINIEIPLNRNQKDRQQLGLNILNLSEADNPSMGPGVYIHSILENSLASHQGGLRVDDKLISINGRNLDNIEETICQLKNSMQYESVLAITISRAYVLEQPHYNNETLKKEHFLLPNKMSLGKEASQSSDFKETANNSRYYSNDSLSHHNNNFQLDHTAIFIRDCNGRRSMSEKSKAHEDPSQYTFYKETRTTGASISDDRLYSTLPNKSKLKKITYNQSTYQHNKSHAPVKPSQIKQLNAPKYLQDPVIKASKTPSRSISLRNSPTKVSQQITDPPQSPRNISLTTTHDQQPIFNRAMNNSFKKAVHKNLPANGQYNHFDNSTEIINSNQKESDIIHHQTPSENPCPIYNTLRTNNKIPRSNSVKTSNDKNKDFNLKKFLTFVPSVTKSVYSREKSDTFTLNHPPKYNLSGCNTNDKHLYYSPMELPAEMQHFDDPVIIDSTKRVLEWQMKNNDAISKETNVNEQRKGNIDFIGNARTSRSNRITLPTNTQLDHKTDLYSSMEVTSQRYDQSKPITTNSQFVSPRNDAQYNDNIITYQVTNGRKISATDDIYATVNKESKKNQRSQNHISKYRF